MTRNELTTMTGSTDRADFAIEILLKQVQPDFIRYAVRAEAAEINSELKDLERAGWVVKVNGSRSVNWAKAEKLNGWNLTEEQEAAYDAAWHKCAEADHLIGRLNRVMSLLAKM
jgi:hypothetical protein